MMDVFSGSTIAEQANGLGWSALNRLKYPGRLIMNRNGSASNEFDGPYDIARNSSTGTLYITD